jgi:hypothetical protein
MLKTCIECIKFKEENDMGFCKKYNWIIDLGLAKRQAVCNEEDEAKEIKMVTVLSPSDLKGLISKEAYEKEKNGENFWKPIALK